jgi:signal transduction histidine kinase/DNA-binding response OmpR family regulator
MTSSGFQTTAETRRPRVLVIDDEPSVRDFLTDALTQNDFAVDVAEDGQMAIDMARSARFDVALCDLVLPGLGGLETVEQLKKIDPDIEVIIITGYGTFENAVQSLRKGALDFLQKPLVIKELILSLDRALERRDLRERVGLFDLSRTIFSTLDLDELYGRVVKSAIQVLRGDDASLMLHDENGKLFIAVSTSLQHEILAGTHLTLGERIAGRVAQQPEPVVINEDVTRDERFGGVRPMRPIHASIVCPLMMRGQLIGVLNVNRVKIPDRYTEHDRRNAMILSSLVALALGNASLHKELQVRLQQLSDAQEEMIQSEKMTALGNLLSGVAHELNNPLCGILGYAQLLMRDEIDPKVSKGVTVIAREAERAAEIVGKLLTFARREKPEKRPLGINGVILKTLERKSFDLKVSKIDIRADLDPKVPLVMGNFHQLQVVFGHLIQNAQQVMFESKGGGVLAFRTEEKDGRVIATISDDGPGFPEDHARRVFDPFFTTRQVGKGAGLGLSVCFAILRDHGGSIRAAGDPGRGACFTIEIPIASPEALKEAQRAEPADGQTGAGEDAGPAAGPRILVSDGETHVQDLLVHLLDDMGYRFDTADGREGALEKIRSGSYDALIADFSMPHLEGPDLLKTLRAERPDLAQRVIFLSSDPTDPTVREFTSMFGSPLIGKPFSLDAIRTALRRIVETTGSGGDPAIH